MADTPTPPPSPSDKPACCPALNLTCAFWLLRLFMGMRLVMSGLEKMGYFVAKGTATWQEALKLQKWTGSDMEANHGFGDGKMGPIANAMLENTLMKASLIKPFMMYLPYAMVASGVMILLGLFNRVAWFLAGLIWFSLAFGQMLLPDEQTIQFLGLYLFICALALVLVDHNRLRLTRF